MKTFPAVSPLLLELDRQGSVEFGEEWDAKVCEAIRDLRNRYTQLRDRTRKLIDYGSLPVQMAYAFMYVGANANCLNQVLKAAELASGHPLLTGPEMRVTSWGGGPGSDLLALVALLRDSHPDERPKRIVYRVLDKQPNWHEILKTVAKLQTGTVEIEVSFQPVDVTIPEQWAGITSEGDDLLMMSFFVSEVCALKLAKPVWDCLTTSLASLKKASLLVFNDSNAYTFHSYFDKLSQQVGGFETIVSENGQLNVETDFDDFFRQCMGRFDSTSPKLASNAAYRVLKRQ
jgi:hypothetical protein